ncbi:hypothetical protein M501DRAFT_1057500 [Patellaria atrata CBS 101060]|uniref:Uncharacterized protein n=1 Tax=Patellaria atrata CBS 101060 TaxID=1346257 RepID=A0A9P4SAQ7_9PEZI|nr:hypothetical protein M501DRAFT_1057500 [Patellaria atrata CBS 101060]
MGGITQHATEGIHHAHFQTSGGKGIIDFLRTCSKFELSWFIEQTLAHFPRGRVLKYPDLKVDLDKIRIDVDQRILHWEPESEDEISNNIIENFISSLFKALVNGQVTAERPRRVRESIAAIVVLQKIIWKFDGLVAKCDEEVFWNDTVSREDRSNGHYRYRVEKLLRPTISKEATSTLGYLLKSMNEKIDGKALEDVPRGPVPDSTAPVPAPTRDADGSFSHSPNAQVVTRPPLVEGTPRDGTSTLILPCAGRSSRFPGTRPKWILTQPNGRLMVVDSIAALELQKVHRVVLGVLKEHVDKHCGSDVDAIIRGFDDGPPRLREIEISVVILDFETRDHVQTVECIVRAANVQGPIFMKDCDNSFRCDIPGRDGVALFEVRKDLESVSNPAAKSYATFDNAGIITNIVEKVMLGSHFCCGGYSFGDAIDFLSYTELARKYQKSTRTDDLDLSVSDVIWLKMVSPFSPRTPSKGFMAIPVFDYEDWGTLVAWQAYTRTFSTLFVDIDGTLVKNSGKNFKPSYGDMPALEKNVMALQKLYAKGRTHIILTTTRPEEYRDVTIKQMKDCGVPYHGIVFSLLHARRVVINDYAVTNPYPCAVAINLQRNGEELAQLLV